MAEPIAFSEPLVLDLGDGLKSIPLRSIDEAEAWFSEERHAWEALNRLNIQHEYYEQCRSDQRRPIDKVFDTIRDFRARVATDATQLKNADGVRDTIRSMASPLADGQCLYSKSTRGQFVKEVMEGDPSCALALLGFFSKKDPAAGGRSVLQLGPLFRANRKLSEFELGSGSVEPARVALDNLASEASIRFSSQEVKNDEALAGAKRLISGLKAQQAASAEELSTLKANCEQTFEKMLSGHKQEIKTLENFYKDELAVAEPVTFWAEKERAHVKGMKFWGTLFVVLLVTTIGLLEQFAGPLVREAVQPGQFNLAPLVLITLPVFFVVWLLRMTTRMFYVNAGLRWDARERVAMAKTFLSLLRYKEGLKDAERAEILKSLFRPAAVTSADDSAPPSLLEAMVSKLTGKP